MFQKCVLLFTLPLTLVLGQQVPRQRAPRQQTPGVQAGNPGAVATFTGKFKSTDKKFILVEVENGQSLRMYITGATRFVRAGKPARVSDFQIDEDVTVDTSRDARMNLIAVRVEAAATKTPERKPEN